MRTFDWKGFLIRWSQESLQSKSYEDKIPPEVIKSGWLGYSGATEEQIVQTETRLGASLPRSYREFLKVSNGWYVTTPEVYRLWSTEEIGWFSTRHQSWIDDFTERYKEEHHMSATSNGSSVLLKAPSIPDETYLCYGADQNPKILRVEYLQTALEISDRTNSAIYLLNPQIDLCQDGEWETWFLEDSLPGNEQAPDDWRPGATRYRSFHEMMIQEYMSFSEMQDV